MTGAAFARSGHAAEASVKDSTLGRGGQVKPGKAGKACFLWRASLNKPCLRARHWTAAGCRPDIAGHSARGRSCLCHRAVLKSLCWEHKGAQQASVLRTALRRCPLKQGSQRSAEVSTWLGGSGAQCVRKVVLFGESSLGFRSGWDGPGSDQRGHQG